MGRGWRGVNGVEERGMKASVETAMGCRGGEEQKDEDEKEEAVGEVGVEMGKKHGYGPPVGAPQENNTGRVGMPQESLGGCAATERPHPGKG